MASLKRMWKGKESVMPEGTEEKRYSLREIKEMYLPDRDLNSLRGNLVEEAGRENFLNFLEKGIQSADAQTAKAEVEA